VFGMSEKIQRTRLPDRYCPLRVKSVNSLHIKSYSMGLLTPKNNKKDKKGANNTKGGTPSSKLLNKNLKSSGFGKKQLPGSANRGS
jgi:hypothetical protein